MLQILIDGFEQFQQSFQTTFSVPWWLVLLLLSTVFLLWELLQYIRTPEWEAKWRKQILRKVKTMTDTAFVANKETLWTWPSRKRLALAQSYVGRMPVNKLKKVKGIGSVLLGRIQELGIEILADADERLLKIIRIGPIIYQNVTQHIWGLVQEADGQIDSGRLRYTDPEVERTFNEEKRRLLERQDLLDKDIKELIRYEESVRNYERNKLTITIRERFALVKKNLRSTFLSNEHTPRFFLLLGFTIVLFYSLPLWLLILGGSVRNNVGYLCAWSGFIGTCIMLVSYFGLSKMELNLGLRDPDPREFQEQRLQFQALQLSDHLNIAPPEVRIINERSYNAFAQGTSKTKSRVCFYSALVRDFKEPEIEGILGHELSHLYHNDCRLSVTYNHIVTIFNFLQIIFFSIGMVCFRIGTVPVKRRRKGGGGEAFIQLGFLVSGLFLLLCYLSLYGARITACILQFALSRQAEYRADQSSAALIGKQKMIAALEHLKESPEPKSIFPRLRSSLTVDPVSQMKNTARFMESIFATHPPLGKRIRALEAAGIS